MSKVDVLNTFSASTFIKEYWQKKPVLLKSFLQNFDDPISAEELAGLACEDFSESRLVTEFQKSKWMLKHGPFVESDFTSLPEENWTLLVQAVDQFVYEVAELKKHFNFIPAWRIDDVMISFAAKNGGVGPHFDQYDVFLMQGSGNRRWQLSAECSSSDELQKNSELGILQDFTATDELLLTPGDVLYIPPRFGHWGTAESAGLCYSIGFRAASHGEMLEGFSEFLANGMDPGKRFQDDVSLEFASGAEIDPRQLDEPYARLQELFADREKFNRWFGCQASQAKYPELVFEPEKPFDQASLKTMADNQQLLSKNTCSRFAYAYLDGSSEKKSSAPALFVDGNMAVLPDSCREHILMICQQAVFGSDDLTAMLKNEHTAELLCQLLNQGSLQSEESVQ